MSTPQPTLFGVLNINKPSGISSRRAVDLVWRQIWPQRIGHCGTLDPLAKGVLLIAIGQASRLVSYYQQLEKSYRAQFQLGVTSPTDDLEFELVHCPPATIPTTAEIAEACGRFTGPIMQTPPQYSAVQINGKRAYKLSRKGKSVEIPPRPVHIHQIEILGYQYPYLDVNVSCGSGTYIRSLGNDIAAVFGTKAVMTNLIRTGIGPFRIENAVPLEQVDSFEVVQSRIEKAWRGLTSLQKLHFDEEQITNIRQGRRITVSAPIDESVQQIAALDRHDELRSIMHRGEGGIWKPRINFGELTTEISP